MALSVKNSCSIAKDQYSRPPELIALLCIEAFALFSSRGSIDIQNLESVANKYTSLNPKSADVISMFMINIYKNLYKEDE